MKTLNILVVLSLISLFLLNSCTTEKNFTYDELKEELRRMEITTPTYYLVDQEFVLSPQQKLVRKASLFRSAKYEEDGALIKGEIKNTAVVATFKDIVMTVSYLSKTESIIKEERHVFYEYIEPNSTKKFSVKVYPPDASEGFSLRIVDATPAY